MLNYLQYTLVYRVEECKNHKHSDIAADTKYNIREFHCAGTGRFLTDFNGKGKDNNHSEHIELRNYHDVVLFR